MGIIEAIMLTGAGIAIGFILRVIIADNKEYLAETFAELSAAKIEGIRNRVEKTCLLCDNIPDIKEDVERIKNETTSIGESVTELHHRLDDTHISIPVLQKLMSYDRFFKEYKNEDREEYADKFDALKFMLNIDLCANGLWVKFENETEFLYLVDVYPSQKSGVGLVFSAMQSNGCPVIFTESDIYRMNIERELDRMGKQKNYSILTLYLRGDINDYALNRNFNINFNELEARHKECVKEMLLTALQLQEKTEGIVK